MSVPDKVRTLVLFLTAVTAALGQEPDWQALNHTEIETALLRALNEAGRLGPEHLRFADALYNLGSFYQAAAKPVEAERCYLRSLSAREKIVGVGHASLAEPLNGLVALYLENGLYGKAARFHDRMAIVSRAATLNEHDAARLLHNLASIHYVQRKYSKAEPLFRQALEALEKASGQHDRERALVLNGLALLCAKTGRQSEAISHSERALVFWERTFGPSHPHVARALTNLAGLYVMQGRHVDAELQFQRALTIAESTLGRENLLVANILTEYGVLLRKTKRKTEAKILEQRAQAIRENQLDHAPGRHTIDVRDLQTLRVNPSANTRQVR